MVHFTEDQAPMSGADLAGILGLMYLAVVTVLIAGAALGLDAAAAAQSIDWTYATNFTA